MNRFTDLKNQTLLDLGCGYGWYTNYFTKIGANAVGCDGSNKMIEIAQSRYHSIKFEQVNILDKLPYKDNSFDIVFCNQVLMDLENINELIPEINRITKEQGIFYISIVHPAFYDAPWSEDEHGFKKTKVMKKYLSEYNFDNEFWGKTKHYHRPLSKYLNTIINSGFSLIYIDEPKAYDGIDKNDEFPLFLFAEFKKISIKI